MKYLIALLFAISCCFAANSQMTIKLEDVNKHIGDSVKVCGKVYGIRFLETAKDQPTFINLGGAFPNQLLTVVIWNDVRKQFEKAPEEMFKDKEVCVVGRIELFRERPQIVLLVKEHIATQ